MQSKNKEILRIAIPAIMESLFVTLVAIIDSRMVSSLGITAISAVAVTNQPKLFFLCIFFAINTTIASLTARSIGEDNRIKANQMMLTAMCFSILCAAIVSVCSMYFADPIMRICSKQADTLQNSILYFRIIMGGLVCNVVFMTANAVLRGCGATNITLYSNLVFTVVNITLNYLLIEGNWGAPALGIKGAAVATVVGTCMALLCSLLYLWNTRGWISLKFCMQQKLRPCRECFFELYAMWKKIFTENIFTRFGFLLIGIIAAYTGSLNMSIYAVGMHLMNINFALGSGLQTAAVALVGKCYGAGSLEEVRSYSKQILKIGRYSSGVLSIMFILLGRQYYSFFGNDVTFIKIGALSCLIIGIIAPIQTQQIIYNGIFQAIGDVRYTMISAAISITLVNTAASFIGTVVIHGGIWGIWFGALAGQLVRMFMLRYRYGEKIMKGV